MTSAFPKTLDELIQQAKEIAREQGALPSQNKLKAALHVRAERAKAVLSALTESGFDPTEPDSDTPVPPRLHLVPQDATEPEAPGWDARDDGRDEFTEVSGTLPLSTEAPAQAATVPAEGPAEPNQQAAHVGEPAARSGRPATRWSWPWSRPTAPEPTGTAEVAPVPVARPVPKWPLILLSAPAFVAIWSGWVGLGVLTGFGVVHPLPGIADGFTLNSAITLPIGVETYAAYALRVWLAPGVGQDERARQFAKWSAIGSLLLGIAGQVAYHLMTAAHVAAAPWPITTAVSGMPVIVLGLGAALAHLQRPSSNQTEDQR